ncbi:MAG: glycoside hydrolase [Actinomycetota bacterium]|nr:glycoside hydrolase [Actinomycetota bacterium]
MGRTTRSRAALAAAVVLVAVAGAPATWAKDKIDPVVTAAVQVSTNPDPTRAHSTPQIARNPKTGVLVIADSEARTKKTVDVYRSTDDGRSWAPGGDPMLKPWTDASGNADSNIDHSMTFDRNGVLYLAFQANDPRFSSLPRMDRPVHLFLAKSTDDGATFTTVRVYEAPEAPEADRGLKRNYRPWVAVDPVDPRFVYVSWMQFHTNDEPVSSGNKALIMASADGGRTFDKPFSLREGDPQGSYEGRPAVDGKGVVHVVFAGRGRVPPGTDPSAPPPIRNVLYRSSSDHGRTWTDAKEIDPGNAGFSFNRKWGLRADPNSDNLYAVWYGTPDPRATRPQADRDIYMRMSYDSGRTWSDRVLVNTDAPMADVQHYDPAISVAPNGRLDVVWYDGRNSPSPEIDLPSGNNGGFQDVYYRYSFDGGRTFSDELKVTDRIIDRNYGVWSNNNHVHAPIGMVSTDDAAYITWQDSRNGTNAASADDTYFATVRLHGTEPAVAAEDHDSGVPRPVLIGAGLAVGMGLAMLIVFATGRRRA